MPDYGTLDYALPQDPDEARLGPRVLPYVAAIPIYVFCLTLLIFFLRWVLPRPPVWARPFARETVAEYGRPQQPARTRYWTFSLLLVSLLGVAAQATSFGRRITDLPCLMILVSWILATALTASLRPASTSWPLVALHLSLVASQFIIQSHGLRQWSWENISDGISLAAAVAAVGVTFAMPMRSPQLPTNGIGSGFEKPTKNLRSPEDNISLWQWISVSWMAPLIAVGQARQLHDDDVWFLGYEFQHTRLHETFRTLKGTVLRRLIDANGLDLIILSAITLVDFVAIGTLPMTLQKILETMENPNSPRRASIMWAVCSASLAILATHTSCFGLWIGRRCYERSRGEMITMMYEKTLKRKVAFAPPAEEKSAEENGHANGIPGDTGHKPSRGIFQKTLNRLRGLKWKKNKPKSHDFLQKSKQPASLGKILNMTKADVYEIAQQFWDIDQYLRTPGNVVLAIVYIWYLLGPACLVGALTVLVAQIFTAAIFRVLLKWAKRRRTATDTRLQVVSQFIEAIRHLRWYGWQNAWIEQIFEKRETELNLRVITCALELVIRLVDGLASGMFPVVAFFAYTILLGKPLRVDIAFPALQLFDNLESSMRQIPGLITKILNAFVALKRLEDFMIEPDKIEPERHTFELQEPKLDDASFAWPGNHTIVLKNISLRFHEGLNVVGGKVAAGKSALLLALLGELDQVGGRYDRSDEPVGYCAQTPWLQSMSIRDNILFHSEYEEGRYKKVLDACALTPDLATFKHGDLSMIGENGIGLSGGQRARVALARAVYSHAKILMLDDPLSALDHQTAEWIVDRCLTSSLVDGRTVILVTHRLDICKSVANQLIEIEDGTARVVGNIKDMATDAQVVSRDVDEAEAEAEREAADAPDEFIEVEKRQHGGIEFSVYWEYIKAGKLTWWAVLVVFLVVAKVTAVGRSWYLKEWGEAYSRLSDQSTPFSGFFNSLPAPEHNVRPWIFGFLVISIAQTLMSLAAQAIMVVIMICAGRELFRNVVDKVAHATFHFYNVTPTGRLMNRMTSDIGSVDGNITGQFQTIAELAVTWISSIVVIASITPIFFVYSIGMTAGFVYFFLKFLPASQSLRRLETVSLSPLMSDFGALVDGLTTVRAFCAQSRFQDRVIKVTDTFQKMDHFYWSLQAWLNYRFDLLSDVSVFFLFMLALFTGISPGLVGFALISAVQLVRSTHQLCRSYGQLQMDFVSVERIVELLHLEQEDPGRKQPPASWPTFSGDLTFSGVTIRYAPQHDPALKDLSFSIKGGATTAIVGRTGSGKSTIALSLLGTLAPEAGSVTIDGMDVAEVNKQALRSRITFLAQDPVLFPGSLRKNLDPLNEHSDRSCIHVVERVCPSYDWTLDTQIEAGGRNLSQGQRQLIGLARAILRKSSIVILDEATASVDLATSSSVQNILREELGSATVVTIAHRVEAVRGAERYLVLGKGRLVEEGKVDVDGKLLADG